MEPSVAHSFEGLTLPGNGANLRSMVESNADRQRKFRQALKAQGLRRYAVWVRPSEWPTVQRLLERLAKRRNAK